MKFLTFIFRLYVRVCPKNINFQLLISEQTLSYIKPMSTSSRPSAIAPFRAVSSSKRQYWQWLIQFIDDFDNMYIRWKRVPRVPSLPISRYCPQMLLEAVLLGLAWFTANAGRPASPDGSVLDRWPPHVPARVPALILTRVRGTDRGPPSTSPPATPSIPFASVSARSTAQFLSLPRETRSLQGRGRRPPR